MRLRRPPQPPPPWRPAVVFVFGLLHGLGFAGVGWGRNRPWYRRRVVIPASAAIALVGLWWALEQTLM